MQIIEGSAGAGRPRLVRFGAHAADDARSEAGPVVGRRRGSDETQRVADVLQLAKIAGTRRAIVQMRFNRNQLANSQLAIVEGLETPPHCRAGQERHASLNWARSASRARASLDFTVPTAIPSENPISS